VLPIMAANVATNACSEAVQARLPSRGIRALPPPETSHSASAPYLATGIKTQSSVGGPAPRPRTRSACPAA
jgi:hypothetical protein